MRYCLVSFCLGFIPLGLAAQLQVFVSIQPQAYFVERIAGEWVTVESLVPADNSPESFQPTIQQVAALAQADYYFTQGLPFEGGMVGKLQTTAIGLKVIETQAVTGEFSCVHPADSEHHHHAHAGENHFDPHTWLSPERVKQQIAVIRDALLQGIPSQAAKINDNTQALIADIDAMDNEIKTLFKPFAGYTFLVYHPAFGYFADAYGLQQQSIEFEGKGPSPKQLLAVLAKAKAEQVRVVFTQPQFSQKSAEVIANAIGGQVVVLDPLAYNYLENMRSIAYKIASSFGGKVLSQTD